MYPKDGQKKDKKRIKRIISLKSFCTKITQNDWDFYNSYNFEARIGHLEIYLLRVLFPYSFNKIVPMQKNPKCYVSTMPYKDSPNSKNSHFINILQPRYVFFSTVTKIPNILNK